MLQIVTEILVTPSAGYCGAEPEEREGGGETKEEDNILHALTTYLFSVPGFVNTLRPEIGKRRKGRREQGNEPESVSTDTQV